jgi:general secretion pathway protein H
MLRPAAHFARPNGTNLRRRSASGSEGFTLIEMIVALLIVGTMVGVAMMGVSSLTNAKLKEEAGRLASVIRACYSLAALNGRTYRLVFDLDAGTYKPEWTENPVVLSDEREIVTKDGERYDPEEIAKKKNKGGRSNVLGIGNQVPRLPKPGWNKVDESDIGLVDAKDGTIRLSKDVVIDGVFTTHQLDVISKGKAEMHFFPQGWAERAIIYLKENSKNGETMSVDVDPLTGRAFVTNGAIKIPPEDLDERGKEEEGDAIF